MRRRLSVGQALQDPPMKISRNKTEGRKLKRITQTWTNSVGHNDSEGYNIGFTLAQLLEVIC